MTFKKAKTQYTMIGRLFLYTTLFAILWTACGQRSEYEKLVKRELASGERYDSLFMGIHFGMRAKDFFEYCYEMNQKNIFFQGNAAVKYRMKEELPMPATIEFYPEFQDTQIIALPMNITYDAWAPWNKETFADSLEVDVKNLIEDWYGPGFIKVEHPERGVAFVKVDGNRQIVIAKQDDKLVRILFTDLSVKRREKELANKEQPVPVGG